MTQSSTDSSLVERLLGYAESGFATGHKTDCATAAYELVALAADRDAAREVYLTLQQSNAVLASRISTLERELEEASEQRDERRADSDAYKAAMKSYFEQLLSEHNAKVEAQRALTAAEAKAARMGESLKPFASEASRYGAYGDGSQRAWLNCTVADLRAARSALQSEEDREGGE
jgi:chromosome segregation ATPase